MPVVLEETLLVDGTLYCLTPGWCDYHSKTLHLDHTTEVSFTVSWDCPPAGAAKSANATSLVMTIHTSIDGALYDSDPAVEHVLTQHAMCSSTLTPTGKQFAFDFISMPRADLLVPPS
jgi:hypothetical protein